MNSPFLTLEGIPARPRVGSQPRRFRRKGALGFLAAGEASSGLGDATPAARYSAIDPDNPDVNAGTPSLFSQYQGLPGYEGDDLGGWFRHAFTPPRAVRHAVAQATHAVSHAVGHIAKPIVRPLVKFVRYSAAIETLPMTAFGGGRIRNRMLGLKGRDQRLFDVAAKAYRIGAVAVATVVTGGAAASMMSPAAGASFSGWLGSGMGVLKTGAGIVMKDAAGGSLWKFAANAAGQLIGRKYNADSVPPDVYQGLPDAQPVAVPAAAQADPSADEASWGGGDSMPAQVAGSSTPTPGDDTPEWRVDGQQTPAPPSYWDSREQSVPGFAVGAPDSETSPVPTTPGDPVPSFVMSPALKSLVEDQEPSEEDAMSLLRPKKPVKPVPPPSLMSRLLAGALEPDEDNEPSAYDLLHPRKAPPPRVLTLRDRLLAAEPDVMTCDIQAAKALSFEMSRRSRGDKELGHWWFRPRVRVISTPRASVKPAPQRTTFQPVTTPVSPAPSVPAYTPPPSQPGVGRGHWVWETLKA